MKWRTCYNVYITNKKEKYGMVLGYIRTINIDADILLKSEQLDRLKSVKCDEIVEEEVEKISENIADRLSSRDILVIESLNVLGKMTGENLQ